MVDSIQKLVLMNSECIKKYKDSLEYKKWKIARFFTLYCDSPTEPEEISEETVLEFEKIFSDNEDKKNIQENSN